MKLSSRETECLTWVAQGKSYRDISLILGLSFATVKTYLDVLRYKLDAVNLPHAVAKAIALGIITVEFGERTST